MTRGADYDVDRALRYLCLSDPALAVFIGSVGPCKLRREESRDVFQSLVRTIVYQQLNGRVAERIHQRLDDQLQSLGGVTPAAVLGADPECLRTAGLSRSKLSALLDLAARTIDGTVPSEAEAHALREQELIHRLTQVHGIGRWSVEMLMIFHLGRADVLPLSDLGVRKGFAAIFRRDSLPSPGELATAGERWRPYRSVATWYLWRAAEVARTSPKR
jgi:3-methyladenine DNA glycosylase/8-oxoguanine DNA glycosylase